MLDNYSEETLLSSRGKFKRQDKSHWEKTKAKIKSNSKGSKTPRISCTHDGRKVHCFAKDLTNADIEEFCQQLYAYKSASEQNNFINKYMAPRTPKRKRPRKDNPRSRLQCDYFIPKQNKTLVKVCASSFRSITLLSVYRLNGLAMYFFKNGCSRPERRGGSRSSCNDTEITQSIIKHIQSVKCRSSHYGRNKSVRSYLPPELTVRKLYKMWQVIRKRKGDKIASYSKYYKIFSTKFNLGFGNPRTDVCSFCELKKTQIKNALDLNIKQNLITEAKAAQITCQSILQKVKQTRR